VDKRKYFIVSLHRSGTRSTTEFLTGAGFNAIHWPAEIGGVDYQQAVAGRETELEFVVDQLKPVIDASDSISDVPIPGVYEVLARRYADARFILCYRNAFDWVQSVRKHYVSKPVFAPFVRVLYWRYFPWRPVGLQELSDDQLLWLHNRHTADVIQYFADEDRGRLGTFNLDGSSLSGELGRFIGVETASAFPQIGGRFKRSGILRALRLPSRART
jgi:hypothetical protein